LPPWTSTSANFASTPRSCPHHRRCLHPPTPRDLRRRE
jgi:hypothetical protein